MTPEEAAAITTHEDFIQALKENVFINAAGDWQCRCCGHLSLTFRALTHAETCSLKEPYSRLYGDETE